MKIAFIVLIALLFESACSQELSNTKIDGYRGIWFELNQKYDFGDKYSGALGTYTAKHVPLAIYSKEVNKTFFVFGGTKSETSKHLLCMIGEFNHKTGMVSKPTVVCDKEGVEDPHDNPSVMIDDKGFIWVFISGRGRKRPGFKYVSKQPFNINEFSQVTEEEMTYPQPWMTEDGYFNFFTKYLGVRQLFYETSSDGINWTDDKLLAAIPEEVGDKSGHYQVSNVFNNKIVATFFNRHIEGHPDKRTNLYYVQSSDFGSTWQTVNKLNLELPIVEKNGAALVADYSIDQKRIYMKDMGFDSDGNPACLYIRSNGHEPGPYSTPYEWCVTRWTNNTWLTSVVTTSDHNYDMGSLYITDKGWQIVGPTEKGKQAWGVGGEIAIWQSIDEGNTWEKIKMVTEKSKLSHSYVRRPVNFADPFSFFWANGHSHEMSKSELYFGNFNGNVWRLPYNMTDDYEKPVKIN